MRQIDVLTSNDKTLAHACREGGYGGANYYRWRKIYGGMKIEQAKKYKKLEHENTRLKNLVADLSLRKVILKEAIKGNFQVLLGVKMQRNCRTLNSFGINPCCCNDLL